MGLAIEPNGGTNPAMGTQGEAGLAPLERDIDRLRGVLHAAVEELWGPEALALTEHISTMALSLREGTLSDGRDALASAISELDDDSLELVARVTTLWFHLFNTAEAQHRLRVLRERDGAESCAPESTRAALRSLRDSGLSAEQVQAQLDLLHVMPVLTAHPTEAKRRTVIEHVESIGHCLDELDRHSLSSSEHSHVRALLHATVVTLAATEESRASKPTPRDEIRAGLDVFERTLLEVTPAVYRELEQALVTTFPDYEFSVPSFLTWGTWIGGDRDGNPHVDAATTRTALERQRRLVLQRYLRDVNDMMHEISVSGRRVRAAAGLTELTESIANDRQRMSDLASRAQRKTPGEPWREKLWYVRARLKATLERGEHFYPDPSAYVADLQLIERTLHASGFAGVADVFVRDARRRAQVFGFHLASLDIRQHSAVHERAVGELLSSRGIANYASLNELERQQALTEILESPDLGLHYDKLSSETAEVLATLDRVGRARREQGVRVCQRYIVSFTNAPSDLLEVLFLVRAARLSAGELRPVPLLEQLEDLNRAGELAETMLSSPAIRAALQGELEVMIGYSDAGKQIGYFASAVALRRAQEELAAVARKHSVKLTIFHGRGGAIGRGGGPANRAIRAQPPEALRGRIRTTEQGETITTRYGRAEIAKRDLEQMIHAVLVAGLAERSQPSSEQREGRARVVDKAAEQARSRYRALLADGERIARYALAATPIQQVAQLPLGSRPASRKPGLALEALRAIPWVFSWNQSRHGIPGWFGVGTALEVIVTEVGLDSAREMYREWPFFRALLNNAQLALVRADIDVARCYAALADRDARQIFPMIEDEHQRTLQRLLEVTQRDRLLGNRPHLVSTVQRRNAYIDIVSHAQIELMRRLPEAVDTNHRDRLRGALFVTINGIAAGLQTAG